MLDHIKQEWPHLELLPGTDSNTAKVSQLLHMSLFAAKAEIGLLNNETKTLLSAVTSTEKSD